MSNLENLDIMLGNYIRNDLDCQSGERETEGDLESNELHSANPASEDFRSLNITNSRENSEITIETAKMNNNEITTKVTRKVDDFRVDLNTQILEVINSAVAENVLPSIQNVLRIQESGLYTRRDHQSGRLDRSPEDSSSHVDHRSRVLDERPRHCFNHMDHRSMGLNEGFRDYSGEKDHGSGRLDEKPGSQFSHVDHRARRLDKSPRGYPDQTDDRSAGLDRSPLGRSGQQDQQDRSKLNPKFRSHVGLNQIGRSQ